MANIYTEIISDGLNVEIQEAEKIQEFIFCWFDDFRWGSSTKNQIIYTAKKAQAMMKNPKFAELLSYEVGA